MKNHGFVLHAKARPARPIESVWWSGRGTDMNALASGVRLFARPFPTTPEAEKEPQPIVTSRLVMAYAGHLDNRREVAGRLGRPELASAADGEVLAAAYAAWGPEFPAKVIGEFVFALLDRQDGGVVAGVDSLGVGRLFYREEPDGLWVSSDLDLLLSQLPRSIDPDRAGLIEYIAGASTMYSGRTVYADLREIPGAHVLSYDGKRLRTWRYWQPDPERKIVFRREGDYDEAVRSLVFEGVEAALRASGPVSVDLSGGLDSSTVTAAAALLTRSGHVTTPGLSAFSLVISYPPEDNEVAYQQALLAQHPLPHRALPMDTHPVFKMFDEDPPAHPYTDILSGSRLRAMRDLLGSNGVRVSLTGIGGDQVFCGDGFPPAFLAEWRQEGHWGAWARGVRAWARRGDRSLWNLIWRCSRARVPDKFAGRLAPKLPAWIGPDVRQAILRRTEGQKEHRLYPSPARQLQYSLATRVPRLVRFNGLPWEERHPLLYRPLVDFMLAIPWEHKVRPDQDRVIQRRAFEGILPDLIRLRTGKGEGKSLLINGVRQYWSRLSELLEDSLVAELGLIDPPSFKAACDRLRHGLLNRHMGFFMAVLSLEVWLRRRRPGAVGVTESGLDFPAQPISASP